MSRVWSISKLHQWEQCGLQYGLEHETEAAVAVAFPGARVVHVPPRVEGPALKRGSSIHETLDKALRETKWKLPQVSLDSSWATPLKELHTLLKKHRPNSGTEVLWSFDDQWFPTEGNSVPWHRQKLDAWYVDADLITIIDFKTGRRYHGKHTEQMQVYALGALARYPNATRVSSQLWYLDEIGFHPLIKEFDVDKDVIRLARRWHSRAEKFRTDTKFSARPGEHCRWCAYSKKKGGPCPAA